MKNLALITLLFTSLTSFSQQTVTFERTKKTERLFDENNPLSFMSLLQQNATNLNYFYIQGMDAEVYTALTDQEKKSTFKYVGPQSDIPFVDEFGEPMIVTVDDSYQAFLYPSPDSMFIDLYGIDKIVFTLHDGDDEPMKRLNKLHLWKRYESGMQRVLTLDAAAFMRFDGAQVLVTLNEDQTKKLAGKSDQATLWSTMREESLKQLKWFYERSDNGVFQEERGYAANSVQTYFPFAWGVFYSVDFSNRDETGEEPFFRPDFDFSLKYPFSNDLGESVNNSSTGREELEKKFDGVHFIKAQEMTPLVDEYGDVLMAPDANGDYQTVYLEPRNEYFFFDYNPIIMMTKSVKCDSEMNCFITPTSLLFCLNTGNEKPELVSQLTLDFENDQVDRSYLNPFLADFKAEELWSSPELAHLKSMINKKKYWKKDTFKESTVPCEACATKKGQFTLCWRGKPISKNQFDLPPIELSDGSFLAKSGEMTYLLDNKGNELFHSDLDTVYVPNEYAGTYIGQKGENWMIFSKNGEYSMPMTRIPDGFNKFQLYDYLPTQLDDLSFVCEGKNGLKGLIDTKGNVSIPYEYHQLYTESTFGEIGDEFGELTKAIGKKEMNGDWTVFDANYQALGTLKAGDFFGTIGAHLLFQTGNHIDAYHGVTRLKDPTYFSVDRETHIFKDYNKGVVNRNGTLIVPPMYQRIDWNAIGDRAFYFCTTYDRRMDIYDTLGMLISSFDDVYYCSVVCDGDDNFYKLFRSPDYEIMGYDKQLHSFSLMYDKLFGGISCDSLDPKEPLAKGTAYVGKKLQVYYLYRDGRLVPVEE